MAAQRRSYGTGALYERADSAGRVTYYGRWHRDGRRLKRALGPKRSDGSKDGLTRRAAEAKLRELMRDLEPAGQVWESSRSDRRVAATCPTLRPSSAGSSRHGRPSSRRCGFTSSRSSASGP